MLYRVLRNCYELSRNEWLKPADVKQLQQTRMRAILGHVYENVELYHKKFDSAGVKPESIRTLEDLSRLPFTVKQEIRDGIPYESVARGYDVEDCVRMSTSGTTGGPMPVYYDKRFWDYVVAQWYYRQLRELKLNPWDKIMDIFYHRPESSPMHSSVESTDEPRPKSRGKTALGPSVSIFNRWLRKAYLAYSAEEIIPDMNKYQPKIIRGNCSYLKLVAETIIEKGIRNIRPKALVSWGEIMDENSRRFLESSFSCEAFDSYGANEIGTIASQCKRKEGLHIPEDFIIVEVIRDGESVGPGEQGEIVVTGLLNYAMPLIRYRVGDIGILDDALCPCGRGFHLLKSIEGRIVDCLILPDGGTISPRAIMTAVQGTPGVSRYQVVQENKNKVTIELMKKDNDREVSIENLKSRCHEVLGDDIEIEVFIGDRQNLKAKFRPVISKLTVSQEPRWTKARA